MNAAISGGAARSFYEQLFNIGLTDRFACREGRADALRQKHPFTVVLTASTRRVCRPRAQRRALLRGELGVTDQDILFGHVGRFSDQKNHPGLLKIFAAVRTRLPKRHGWCCWAAATRLRGEKCRRWPPSSGRATV